MKKIFTLALALLPWFVNAQDEHFLYGRITMNDSKVYEGPIRWGKEEVYWTDIFNAEKTRNVGSSRVDLQACKLEYSIVSPK